MRVLTVRTATPGDAREIVRVNVHGWQTAYAGIVPDDVLAAMDVDARTEQYRYRLTEPSPFETLVAGEDGAVAGYTSIGPYRLEGRDGPVRDDIGEVLAIYVDPPRWGTGVGRLLMTAALDRLRVRGFRTVRLWVLVANRQARRFYESAGFAPDGATAHYPVGRPDGGVVELPEMRYARRLP